MCLCKYVTTGTWIYVIRNGCFDLKFKSLQCIVMWVIFAKTKEISFSEVT